MFGLFKSKSAVEKLKDRHKKLLQESHRLSTINRTESDKKAAEADQVLKEIDLLRSKEL